MLVPPLFGVIMTKGGGDDPGYSIQESQEGGGWSLNVSGSVGVSSSGSVRTFPGSNRILFSLRVHPNAIWHRKPRIHSHKAFDFLFIGFVATAGRRLLPKAENLPQKENGVGAAVLTQESSLSENK
jgi:hypothetical protein